MSTVSQETLRRIEKQLIRLEQGQPAPAPDPRREAWLMAGWRPCEFGYWRHADGRMVTEMLVMATDPRPTDPT